MRRRKKSITTRRSDGKLGSAWKSMKNQIAGEINVRTARALGWFATKRESESNDPAAVLAVLWGTAALYA